VSRRPFRILPHDSITQFLLHRLLYHLLVLTVGPSDAPRLHDSLLAFCETKTGLINTELFSLAREVRSTPALLRLFREHSSREIVEEKLLSPFRDFLLHFETFLRHHGHREIEFDAYQPTWLELPWVVLDHVRLLIDTDAPSPSQREHELRIRMLDAEIELFQRLSPSLHFFFHELIRLARAYTSLDDLEHYQTTRLTLPLRKGLRELGRRLYIRGVLADPMDVFFAHVASIEKAVLANDDRQWRSIAESIRTEKDSYLRDRQRTPAWTLDSSTGRSSAVPAAPVTQGSPQEPAPRVSSPSNLTGLPGSPGQAQGQVFLVRSMDDFAAFPKGAVLVARTTNPTWTPLFYNAVAIVTESGGPLSHGAVTAREMQIPAIMSVRNCMSALRNGDTIHVDGTRGIVTILAP
jgi:rifampicin phosphotransferase